MYLKTINNFKLSPVNTYNINMKFSPVIFINEDVILISSIFLETAATFCLKNTLINKKWFIPAYLAYGISFYLFPKSLNKYSLSLAYTIWSGLGIILTTFIDVFLYKLIITKQNIFGICLIISGIKLLN